ncbi:hypothetical protein MRX96_045648 [Rhipicephalus microplus]
MLRPSLDDQNTTIRGARTLEACHVYLCSHPIPCGSLLMGLASSSTSQCGNLWHKHWVVIFDFGEREVFVCDATKGQHRGTERAWVLGGEDVRPQKRLLV